MKTNRIKGYNYEDVNAYQEVIENKYKVQDEEDIEGENEVEDEDEEDIEGENQEEEDAKDSLIESIGTEQIKNVVNLNNGANNLKSSDDSQKEGINIVGKLEVLYNLYKDLSV